MTRNLAHACLLVAWIILMSGMRFLSPGYLSAPIGSSRFSLPTMIIIWDSWLERVRGPCGEGSCDSNDVSDVVPVVLIGLDRWPRAVFMMENFFIEVDGSRCVWVRYLLDAKGHQRPFPILDDHVEPSRISQVGRCEASRTHHGVLSGVACRCWPRSQSERAFRRWQDVDDCTETCVHGADAPQVASANHALTTFLLSTSCPRSSETYNRKRRSMWLTPAPVWGSQVTHEDDDKAKKGG